MNDHAHTTKTFCGSAERTDGDRIDEIFTSLRDLRVALEDIRGQIAGKRKETYTIEEVADLVGRSSYTVRRWVGEGRLNAVRVQGTGPRGRLLITDDEVRKLIRAGLGGNIPAIAVTP